MDYKIVASVTNPRSAFNHICEVLSEFGIDFDWKEKDRDKAIRAWGNFNKLNSDQKSLSGLR